jgi:hypothetical protein
MQAVPGLACASVETAAQHQGKLMLNSPTWLSLNVISAQVAQTEVHELAACQLDLGANFPRICGTYSTFPSKQGWCFFTSAIDIAM